MTRTSNITRAARRIRDTHAIQLTAAKAIAQALHARGWLYDDQDNREDEVRAAVAFARSKGGRITQAEADAAFAQGRVTQAGASDEPSGIVDDAQAMLAQHAETRSVLYLGPRDEARAAMFSDFDGTVESYDTAPGTTEAHEQFLTRLRDLLEPRLTAPSSDDQEVLVLIDAQARIDQYLRDVGPRREEDAATLNRAMLYGRKANVQMYVGTDLAGEPSDEMRRALTRRWSIDDDGHIVSEDVPVPARVSLGTPDPSEIARLYGSSPGGMVAFWQGIAEDDPTRHDSMPSQSRIGEGPHPMQTGRGGGPKPLNPVVVAVTLALHNAAEGILVVASRELQLGQDSRVSTVEPDRAVATLSTFLDHRSREHSRPALVAVDESAATSALFTAIYDMREVLHATNTYLTWSGGIPGALGAGRGFAMKTLAGAGGDSAPAGAPEERHVEVIRERHARWAEARGAETLRAEIGTTADGGPATVDLGPNTPALWCFTGPGTTNALDTAVTALAYGYGPERVRFIRVAAARPTPVAAAFVHPEVDAPLGVDDVDDTARLKVVIEADLRSRAELRRSGESVREAVGELVVVVDDYAGASAAAKRQIDDILSQIGRVGRSEGVRALIGGIPRSGTDALWSSLSVQVTLERGDDGAYSGTITDREGAFTPHYANAAAQRGMRAEVVLAAADQERRAL
ncbi:hypothetical protein [Tsukamurella hominis]|uniref:hypothetical protein n=1 Tax=Tsukamurella hominis TaxID=1970232 RepID=UPI0039EB8EF0